MSLSASSPSTGWTASSLVMSRVALRTERLPRRAPRTIHMRTPRSARSMENCLIDLVCNPCGWRQCQSSFSIATGPAARKIHAETEMVAATSLVRHLHLRAELISQRRHFQNGTWSERDEFVLVIAEPRGIRTEENVVKRHFAVIMKRSRFWLGATHRSISTL